MAEIKTQENEANVAEFIESYVSSEQKKQDSYQLMKLMEKVSGHPAKMWGTSLIGFGSYHYKSARSKQEGEWPLVAFSPRKTALSLYLYSGEEQDELLAKLGKHTMGKGCVYVKKLADVDLSVLEKLIELKIASHTEGE